MLRKLAKPLLAVIIGNTIYFLLLMRVLPPSARHGIARLDWGLVIDFWVCLVVYGLIELILRRKRASK